MRKQGTAGRRVLGIMVITAVVMTGPLAHAATITVNTSSAGSYVANGTVAASITDPASWLAAALGGAFWQIIWSPDVAVDLLTTASTTPGNGEKVLASGNLTAQGQMPMASANYGPPGDVDDGTFLAGTVYLRVFDSASPGVGSWYISGSLNGNKVSWDKASPPDLQGDQALTDNPATPTEWEETDMTKPAAGIVQSTPHGIGVVALDSYVTQPIARGALIRFR